MAELMTVHHPETGGQAQATELAYTVKGGLKENGWRRGPLPETAATPATDKKE